jgi:hypothetical protein
MLYDNIALSGFKNSADAFYCPIRLPAIFPKTPLFPPKSPIGVGFSLLFYRWVRKLTTLIMANGSVHIMTSWVEFITFSYLLTQ